MSDQPISSIQATLNESTQKSTSSSGYGKIAAGDDYVLRYPVKRNEKEDSIMFQVVKYISQEEQGGGTSVTINEKWQEAKTAIEKQNADRADKGIEERLTTDGVIRELHSVYPDGKTRVYDVGNMYDKKGLKLGSSVSSRYHSSDRSKIKTKFYVELPIPNELSDTQGVEFGQSKMNAFEMIGFNQASAFMKNPGVAVNEVQEAVNAARLGAISAQDFGDKDGGSVAGVVRAALSGVALNSFGSNFTTNSLLSRSTGQILNSNKELLFEGVNLRSFNFNFTFAPRSKDEGKRVMKIIRSLKRAMAPKAGDGYDFRSNGYTGTGGIFLNAPDIFLIKYLKAGKEHPFLNKFKPCALTSLTVNYTGASIYSSYEDGTPTLITMQMQFSEMNPIYAEDYDDPNLGGVGY